MNETLDGDRKGILVIKSVIGLVSEAGNAVVIVRNAGVIAKIVIVGEIVRIARETEIVMTVFVSGIAVGIVNVIETVIVAAIGIGIGMTDGVNAMSTGQTET